MKQLMIAALFLTAPLMAAAYQNPAQTTNHTHKEVHTDQLKSWVDQGKTMVILDARSTPYFDGTLLPKAKWLPAEGPGDVSEKQILAAVPSKETLVVVYCAGVGCPASGWLADKLTSMGYQNVYEYPEGLKDWMSKKYPTTNSKK